MSLGNIYSDDARRMRQGSDAFGDKIVTMRRTLIDVKSTHGISRLRDLIRTKGSGIVSNPNTEASYSMKVKDAGDEARLFTVERGKYVSGNSGEVSMAVRINREVMGEGHQAKWGYFDDYNGFFFKFDKDGLSIVIKNELFGEIVVPQKEFNVDKMDGKGPSRHKYDPKQGNVFQIYGSGSYCSIHFRVVIIDSNLNQVIQTLHNYARWGAYSITNPNLPIGAVLSKAPGSGDDDEAEMLIGDRQYSLVGQSIRFDSRISNACRLEASLNKDTDQFVPVLSVRRKPEFLGDPVIAKSIDIMCNGPCAFQLRLLNELDGSDPSSKLADVSFEGIPDTVQDETMLEQDTSATSVEGGIVLFSGLVHDTYRAGTYVRDFEYYTLENDQIMVMCVRPLASNSSDGEDDDGDLNLSVILRFSEEW